MQGDMKYCIALTAAGEVSSIHSALVVQRAHSTMCVCIDVPTMYADPRELYAVLDLTHLRWLHEFPGVLEGHVTVNTPLTCLCHGGVQAQMRT